MQHFRFEKVACNIFALCETLGNQICNFPRFENVACNFFVSKMLHATFLCVWVCLRYWTFLETGRLGGACGACACVVVREGEDGGGAVGVAAKG